MTGVDVDALDAARAAATAGPWAQHPSDDEYVIGEVSEEGESYLDVADTYAFRKSGGSADAALIVAAVNALPDLIAEVRRGRALRERLEGLADELAGHGRALVARPDQMPAFHGRQVTMLADRLRAVVAAVDGGEQ